MERVIPSIQDIYESVAAHFGITLAQILSETTASNDPLNTPRAVAGAVCIVACHEKAKIAEFSHRNLYAIRTIPDRIRSSTPRLQLAWGVWWELGGTWDEFDRALRPKCEMLPLPGEEQYVIPGFTRKGSSGDVVAISSCFNDSMELSASVLTYLGINGEFQGEKALNAALIRTAITDYLLGTDAQSWLQASESSTHDGISMDDACTLLGIDPNWLRTRLEKLVCHIKHSREKPNGA